VQDVADERAGDGIDGLERLVQHQQPWRVQQRARERDLLLHARRVVDDQRAPGVGEREHVEQFPRPLVDHRRIHAAQQTLVRQELGTVEPVEQSHAVRQHAEPPLRLDRIGPDVMSEHPGVSAVRPQQPDRHRQGRGLAGAVRAEQAEERSGRHVEVDAGDRDLVVEPLGESADREGRLRGIDHVFDRTAWLPRHAPAPARSGRQSAG
jgi:hypothetical protein